MRRRQKRWLADLSASLGCSINTIRWHEMGIRMMRADMIVAAAQIMGVSPSDLLSIETEESNSESHA